MKKTNEMSKLVGVSRRTLQYYDDEGVLITKRDANNHRIYNQQAVERIWEILIYKEMNFELKEIKYFVALPSNQKKIYLENQKEVVKNQISRLKVQMGFISLVQKYGMPAAPKEGSGKSYMSMIEELREKIRVQVTEGEKGE